MADKHIHPDDLVGKTVDAHTHVGIDLRAFAQIGFPYCSSLEGLYYRMKCHNVDYAVVFPALGAQLYFDLETYLIEGVLKPAKRPLSGIPYEIENKILLKEIFEFCPELSKHFIPFVMVDPGRRVDEQIKVLRKLEEAFPIYGIKISPVGCQSRVTKLLEEGGAFLDFAKEHNWPILLHVTVNKDEKFSQASDALEVARRNPKIRFCLAHSICFHNKFLEIADQLPNVWVDTAAIKIMTELALNNSPVAAPPSERVKCDYSDHRKVMKELVKRFPKTIIWGSDSPYYSYIVKRLEGEDFYFEFKLKGTYADEKAALDSLSEVERAQINSNMIKFIFGR